MERCLLFGNEKNRASTTVFTLSDWREELKISSCIFTEVKKNL